MGCRVVTVLLALWVSSTTACISYDGDTHLATPDQGTFSTQAYEVLLRDCGFVECHGGEGRFFRVVGPGRTRLSADAPLFEPTTEEMRFTYRSARAVVNGAYPDLSQLLQKPLAPSSGGAGHKGIDVYGRDVYGSPDDANYAVLRAFAHSTALAVQGGGQ